MFHTKLDMWVLRIGRIDEDDDDVGVIGIRFKVVNTFMFLFTPPHTVFQSLGAPFIRRMTASMRDFIDEDTAYHCSSRMLTDVIRVFVLDEIPSVTAEVACVLWNWTHHAIQRRFNSLELEIRLEIIEHRHVYSDDHHTFAREEEDAEEEEGEEEDADDIDDEGEEEEEEEEEEDAVLAWATTESMNSGSTFSHGLFGSSSADEVEAFLRRWRAQIWESKMQCIICLDCLGEAGGLEDEGFGKEKGSKEEEKEVMICQLPCNHLFHEECISRWFEVRDTCPLCRTILQF